MGGNFSRLYTRTTGATISGPNDDTEFDNIINNMTPSGLDDYSATVGQMQSTANPYPGAVESLATSGAGELERLRYLIKQITGKTQWYIGPDTSINALLNQPFHGIDTGVADAYVVTTTVAPTSYTGGFFYSVTITHANATTTPTMNLNGLGAQSIKRPDGSNVAPGDMPLNWRGEFFYNGATHYLLNPAAKNQLLGIRTLASGTSYTPTAGTTSILIRVVGGGAGGTGGTAGVGGGGGGGGSYAEKFFTGIGAGPYTYAIGSGGAGGNGASGTAGGSTTFTGPGPVTVTAPGGSGGSGATGSGGFGGAVATNGDVNGSGAQGINGVGNMGGGGGSTVFGGGGGGQVGAANGSNASGYGGGGGGGGSAGGSTIGGTGANGVIVIQEFS